MVRTKINPSRTTGAGAGAGGGGVGEAAFRAYMRTSCLMRHAMEPYFARHGISGAQWGVLKALHRAQSEGLEGMRLTDLGDRLLVRPPSITGVVDRLQRQGLVARTTDGGDLRAKRVSLTPDGLELVERVNAGHNRQIKLWMGGLTPEEQTQFHDLMDRMASHLEGVLGRDWDTQER